MIDIIIIKKTKCFLTIQILINKKKRDRMTKIENMFQITYIKTLALRPTFLAAETKPSVHL